MTDQHESGHAVHSPRDADFVALEAPPPPASSDQHQQQDHDAHQTVAVRKLVLVTVIALVFMLMEFVGGYVAGSLAVISDAVHMLTDVLGFAIALTAIWIGRRPASDALSFGFHRVEVVGALVSILVIWVLTGVLVYSAAQRCREFAREDAAQVVDGKTMFIVALIGLVMNVVMMRVLGSDGHGHSHGIDVGGHGHSHGHSHAHGHAHGDNTPVDTSSDNHNERHSHDHSHDGHGHSHGSLDHEGHEELEPSEDKMPRRGGVFASRFENLNIQAAYLHVLGDLLQSVGVTIAGAVIWWKPSWQLADPIMTFVFSLLVVATTMGTVRESLHILMEGTPRKVSYVQVERGLASCRDVVAVHDLHIWSLSSNKPALAVHLVSADPDASLAAAQHFLIQEGIMHSTIQIERPATEYPQQCAGERRCA